MATAIISAMTGIPVRHDVAMTGKIKLRGRVLPIGSLIGAPRFCWLGSLPLLSWPVLREGVRRG
jgi:hypothetical protein